MIDTDAGVVARSPFLRVSRPSSAVIELIISNSYSIWVEPIAPPERNASAHTAVIFITTQLPRMFGNSCWRQDTPSLEHTTQTNLLNATFDRKIQEVSSRLPQHNASDDVDEDAQCLWHDIDSTAEDIKKMLF